MSHLSEAQIWDGVEGAWDALCVRPCRQWGGTRSMSRAICRMLAWGAGAKFLVLMLTRS